MPTAMTFNNKAITFGSTPKWMAVQSSDPYNPLSLPPYTIRLKYIDGVTPSFAKGTAVRVSWSPNVWDLTYENADWSNLLRNHNSIIEVLGANTRSVTNMSYMFIYCSSLPSVPLFDTGSATNMSYMFYGCTRITSVPLFDTGLVTTMGFMFYNCTSLTSVPLFNTSSVIWMTSMFDNCLAVKSGALALYQQASTQANPPTYHADTFRYCGSNTVTGTAELAQIPKNWGGTNYEEELG